MALKSDLHIDSALFNPKAIPEEVVELNESIIKTQGADPPWYEVGPAKYREMRWKGQTTLPKPAVLPSGVNLTIPSRDADRKIPCRMFKPENGDIKGLFMHIHGGGWVLQSEFYQDGLLKFYADECGLAVVSVGYRLAPEDPFPAGPNDCYDAADYFVKNGKQEFGGELKFIGGESAGGHLAVLVAFYILKTNPSFPIKGLLLHFGCYDLAGLLPACHQFPRPLIINYQIMAKYVEAFVPNSTEADRRDPAISPFYANLKQFGFGKLPPALFTVGTEDPLLDDSVLMAAKWQMAGSEGILKVYTGAPHGLILFPPEVLESAEDIHRDTKQFILAKLS